MDETKKETTTAEAFAKVHEALTIGADNVSTPTGTRAMLDGLEAYSLLERRMGAMDAALRGCRTHLKCADGCACDVCAALAGASAAPSLEEAEERAREVYEAAISRREHQPVALSLAVRAVVRLAPSGTVSASGPCDCGHSSCTAPALTDAPPVFTLEEVEDLRARCALAAFTACVERTGADGGQCSSVADEVRGTPLPDTLRR